MATTSKGERFRLRIPFYRPADVAQHDENLRAIERSVNALPFVEAKQERLSANYATTLAWAQVNTFSLSFKTETKNAYVYVTWTIAVSVGTASPGDNVRATVRLDTGTYTTNPHAIADIGTQDSDSTYSQTMVFTVEKPGDHTIELHAIKTAGGAQILADDTTVSILVIG